MKQRKWMKLLVVMFAVLFTFGQITGGLNVSAAKRKKLNTKKVTLYTGQSKQLKVSGVKAAKVKWSSSKKSVARVSKRGKIQAKKPGKTTITAKFAGGRLKCRVTVKARKNEKKPASTPTQVPEAPKPAESEPQNPTPNPDPTPSEPSTPQTGKILVAYFSWSGTSERIANNIIAQTGADSFRIEREIPYSSDYQTTAYGDAMTEAQTNARPAIKDPLTSVDQYDKIILCYPIWWHTAPMTVGTFLERYDMTGKKIYPVSQSASMDRSQYEESVTFVRNCAKGASVEEGIFSRDNTAIKNYVNQIMNE